VDNRRELDLNGGKLKEKKIGRHGELPHNVTKKVEKGLR
jgi:hypothetical protein